MLLGSSPPYLGVDHFEDSVAGFHGLSVSRTWQIYAGHNRTQ